MRKIPYILILAILLPMFLGVLTPSSYNRNIIPTAYAASHAVMMASGPVSAAALESEAGNPTGAYKEYGIECFKLNFDFGECIAVLGYYMYVPTGWILTFSGAIFDTFLAFSLSKGLLNEDFVSETWGVVRDIANLGLIFALLYIAIATILQVGGVQLKKAVANVVIIALLINFSFFITRVVIDVTNTIGFHFYKMAAIAGGVPASTPAEKHLSSSKVPDVTEYRISVGLTKGINPQSLMKKETFNKWNEKKSDESVLFVVFLLAAIINIITAFVLFSAAFLFLGRILAFVFLIIASPLAFAAWALPAGGGGFHSKWWKQLLDQGLVAPVFLFFIYVIIKMGSVGGGYFVTDVTSISFADFLVVVLLKAALIIAALMLALNTAKDLSGKAGSLTAKWAGGDRAMRAAKSAAKGTAAFAARNTIGRGATAIAESERFKKFGDNNPTLGRWAKAGTDKVAGAGFGGRKGGYAADLKKQTIAKEKFADYLDKDKDGNTRTTQLHQEPLMDPDTGQQAKAGKSVIDPSTGKKIIDAEDPIHSEKEKDIIKNYHQAKGDAGLQALFAQDLAEEKKKRVEMVSAKEAYRKKLEDKKAWFRSSREAAKNIKSGKTTKPGAQEQLDKIKDELREELKKEMEGEGGKTA